MKKYGWIWIALFGLCSCEKEIDLDYRTVDPLYVIQGKLTGEMAEVLITQTRNMDDPEPGTGLAGAVVSITGDDGTSGMLEYDDSDGYYRPLSGFTGKPGRTYTLHVSIGDGNFSSKSTLHGAAGLGDVAFHHLNLFGEKILFFKFEVLDIPGESNFYCYRMYRNDELYKWGLFDDKGDEDGTMEMLVLCNEEDSDDGWKNEWNTGDIVAIEVQTIDRKVYDYLYSVRLSDRTSSNPIDHFTGGCLGYFSAHSLVAHAFSFKPSAVIEE